MHTISNIKRANAKAGFFFFSRDTMKFFHSSVNEKLFEGPGGVFFVTSEQQDGGHPRLYTVRQFEVDTGNVRTAGNFQEFKTLKEAYAVAKGLSENESHTG
jgi:hypothetical protein